jgi:methylated-DNA-[protein]-cysteine S-methyltransferase
MDATGIYARESAALGRPVQIGVAAGRVIAVSFPDDVPSDAAPDHPALEAILAAVEGGPDPDVEVALTVPTDHRRLLEAVRSIPRGETVSTDSLARTAGLDPDDETDRETVAAALAENPVPILVPDHRVSGVAGATPTAVAERLRALES